MKTKHKIGVFDVSVHIIFILLSLACILPLLLVLGISLTDEASLIQDGYHLIPRVFSLDAYRYAFSASNTIIRAYGVTLFVTVVGTLTQLLFTAMMAYSLTRPEVRGRYFLALLVYFPCLFGGGMVASYILMTQVLHLKNTIWVLFVGALISPGNVLIMRKFLRTIPESLIESARIDGSGEIRTFFQIVLPLAKPSLASLGLFTAIAFWNDWMTCNLYITNTELFNLQYLLQSMMTNISNIMANASKTKGMEMALANLPSESIRMATCIISIGPIILLYPLLQKYFNKGLTIGAVKE